ncbi:MAG: BLUF domain-containing protein [Proteobacteria bacterium]|nr:BLUF domain-containing protein [Ramlibacter sp.]MCA0213755.1 BLUF domain-containing protein [Pseudomonadota bacterium]
MPRRSPSAPQAGEHVMQLLYCSRKTRPMDEAALTDLAEQAARRNARHRISGTLLAGCGLYLQFLEGPVAELDALWDQLQHDRRHTRVQLLMKNLRGAGRLYPAPPLALLYPATPLQFMALARDVRAHANAHAKWTMDAHALAALVDRSARRRERAGAAAGG